MQMHILIIFMDADEDRAMISIDANADADADEDEDEDEHMCRHRCICMLWWPSTASVVLALELNQTYAGCIVKLPKEQVL